MQERRRRRKEAGRPKALEVGGILGGTIRYANPSAHDVESALGSGVGGCQGSTHTFTTHLSHPPTPTAHPGCGWAAGPSVCWSCCSSALRWGFCT